MAGWEKPARPKFQTNRNLNLTVRCDPFQSCIISDNKYTALTPKVYGCFNGNARELFLACCKGEELSREGRLCLKFQSAGSRYS